MTRSNVQALCVFIIGLAALLSHSMAHAGCTVYDPDGFVWEAYPDASPGYCADVVAGLGEGYTYTEDGPSGESNRRLLVCDGVWIFEGGISCDGTLEAVNAQATKLWLNGGWDADGFAAGFSMVIMLFVTGLGIGLIVSVIRKAKGA